MADWDIYGYEDGDIVECRVIRLHGLDEIGVNLIIDDALDRFDLATVPIRYESFLEVWLAQEEASEHAGFIEMATTVFKARVEDCGMQDFELLDDSLHPLVEEPEVLTTMWVLQVAGCPNIEAACREGSVHFGNVYSSDEDSSGVVQLLVPGDFPRQRVRQFARDVERSVGGIVTVQGKREYCASDLGAATDPDRLAQLTAAVTQLLVAYDATPQEAYDAVTWLGDRIAFEFGNTSEPEEAELREQLDPLSIN